MKLKKNIKPLNAVDRLTQSLEKRISTYRKNKERINSEFRTLLAKEDQKIADATLQLKALKRK